MENQETTTTENQLNDFNKIFGPIKPTNEYSKPQAIIIYGNMGTGKTTLATTCSECGNTVLVNFEGRISHIDETETLRIVPTSKGEYRDNVRCDYKKFVKFAEYILQNEIKIKYVIFDTLDAMLQAFIKGMLMTGEISDKYFGRAEVYPRIAEYIQRFKDNGTTVIITAQENNKELTTDLLIVSNFKGHINPVVDSCFYLKLIDNDKRILMLKPSDTIFVKPPTTKKENFNKIPNSIDNPSWKDIVEAIKGVE